MHGRGDRELDNYRQIQCLEFDDHEQIYDFLHNTELNCLSIIHFNIRSYYKNVNEVFIILDSIKVKFSCIVLTEAWLDPDKPLITLDGYEVYSTSGQWNRADGTVVYLKSELAAISQQVKFGDATGLQLDFDIDGRLNRVISVYRSPTMDFDSFTCDLKNYLDLMNDKNTTCFFTGDINIDTSPDVISIEKDRYLDILYGTGFAECIKTPTRVTGHSQTCIDHIFIKHCDYTKISAGVFKTSVTDHYAVIGKVDYVNKQTDDSDSPSTYVDMNKLNALVAAQSWQHVLALQDVNESCDAFINTVEELKTSAICPKSPGTRLKKLKPWITVELIRSIRQRDKMSKLLKKQPFNDDLKHNFQNFRNELANKIKRSKINYYKQKILESENNPKKFWKTINEINGSATSHNKFSIKLFQRGVPVNPDDGAKMVANSFNDFFSAVGSNLASVLPSVGGPPLVDDAAHRADHEFVLEPVTADRVERGVREMRGGSAPGLDGITPSILKNNIQGLALPLQHIINLSISTGVFPEKFKTAKVIPIFKSNSKADLNNYRPISLLSVLSKVLEKCVKWQLQEYLESREILSPDQFGFRKCRNTSDALFKITRILMDSVNNNEKALVVYIDLAKAFDSLNREILFSKLECVGVRGVALKWFRSYLTGRRQVVSINDKISEAVDINYGVVQGSTLGPLLFLIYINNLSKLNIRGNIFLFADDTAVIFQGKTWESVYMEATRELGMISQWFVENSLTMNISKTKCMPIALRPSSEPPAHLTLVLHVCGDPAGTACDCQVVERVAQYKYLGVVFDSSLRWESHINLLKSKLRKFIYVFRLLSNILNSSQLKTIYYAYVESILQYGIVSWGGSYKSLLAPLFNVQKSILKTGFNKPIRHPTELLFFETDTLSVRQLFIKTILVYTYTHKESVITPVTHNYPTRSAVTVDIQVPKIEKAINLTNSYFLANIIYRNIPAVIRGLQVSLGQYKSLIRAWLSGVGPEKAESLLRPLYN